GSVGWRVVRNAKLNFHICIAVRGAVRRRTRGIVELIETRRGDAGARAEGFVKLIQRADRFGGRRRRRYAGNYHRPAALLAADGEAVEVDGRRRDRRERRELPGEHRALAANSLGDVETFAVPSAPLDDATNRRERRETRVDLVAERLHVAFGVVNAGDLDCGPQAGDERRGSRGCGEALGSAQCRAGALEQGRRMRIDVERMLALCYWYGAH